LKILKAAGGIRRLNDSISIVDKGQTQGYMQESMSFQISILMI
jgi:hypothetical protein